MLEKLKFYYRCLRYYFKEKHNKDCRQKRRRMQRNFSKMATNSAKKIYFGG